MAAIISDQYAPWGSLVSVEKRYRKSITQTAAASGSFHFWTCEKMMTIISVVVVIDPMTARPYAAARFVDSLNMIITNMTDIRRNQFTVAMYIWD